MKNPNSPLNRAKRGLFDRWSAEDYPGAEAHFQLRLFAKDIAVFIIFPTVVLLVAQSFQSGKDPKKRTTSVANRNRGQNGENRSQIIDFDHSGKAGEKGTGRSYGVQRRAPGTLVKLQLLNTVETYSTAPVQAQIIDRGLGGNLIGGILIGDANPDPAFDRITMTFRFVRDPSRENVAIPISARALSLDGTLGMNANKKEGFFARSAFSSAASAQNMDGGSTTDLKEILIRALTVGLAQESGNLAKVEQNRSQVLMLPPKTEFFAELTDYFPAGVK
jgi:hypothetical protein